MLSIQSLSKNFTIMRNCHHQQNNLHRIRKIVSNFQQFSTAVKENATVEMKGTVPQTSIARSKLRVKNILEKKKSLIFTISDQATVSDAVSHLSTHCISASLTLDQDGQISGLFTARDVLRYMHETGNGRSKEKSLSDKISNFIVKKDKLLFCSPNDTALQARQMMSQSKIRHIPVIENGEILGIITIKDLADSSFSVLDIGGKKGFIQNVTGRKGVPEGTRISKSTEPHAQAHVSARLAVEAGSYALPHPFKQDNGCGASRRDYGARDLCMDLSLCEDAHFVMRVNGTEGADASESESSSSGSQMYLCVADGVGSWRQFGVDPRQFSHNLVRNAKKTIEIDAVHRESLRGYPLGGIEQGLGGLVMDNEPIRPLDVMVDAWNMTVLDKVKGSSTFCIATLDYDSSQLAYSNLGDCGLAIIRHVDSEKAGYMRERQLPRHERKNDLRITYLAQQQLRSFNLPYQLGYYSGPEHSGRFETPKDADTASIPVMPGDIVLLATDGLFDNIDLEEIVDLVSEWEKSQFIDTGFDLREPSASGQASIDQLAKRLVERAREVSLDKNRDSPFAVLAKENDIMWGGGMPDDTTVIVARIFKSSS